MWRWKIKTFTATQLNKSPQEVFAAAKEDGKVKIKHDRYQGAFIINHVYTVSPAITAISKGWTPVDVNTMPHKGDIITGGDGRKYICTADPVSYTPTE